MTRPSSADLLRWSLVFVWLATAAASLWELNGQSRQLLASAGITDVATGTLLIVGGAVLDAVLVLALWFWPRRTVMRAALVAMVVFTLLATLLDPALWLHPLGPLTKNLPIAAILWVLARPQGASR